MNKVIIDIHSASDHFETPSHEKLQIWLETLVQHPAIKLKIKDKPQLSISFCFVDLQDMKNLNKQYRAKDKPTNVLSFPCLMPGVPNGFLGDIVLCVPQIEKEAREQKKSVTAHWAHLVLHGTLHLLGYDHELEAEAEQMEQLEIELLSSLHFPNPYGALNER